MKNLREQFLKAGLVSKKQAKKAENIVKVDNKKKQKAVKKGLISADEESDAIKQYKQEMEDRKKLDQELNAEIERKRKAKEQVYRAKEVIITRDQTEKWDASIVYRFIVDQVKIHKVMVTPRQQQMLAEGYMGIAKVAENEHYYLLGRADCKLVMGLAEDLVVCLHSIEDQAAAG